MLTLAEISLSQPIPHVHYCPGNRARVTEMSMPTIMLMSLRADSSPWTVIHWLSLWLHVLASLIWDSFISPNLSHDICGP
eukprot:c12119_g1_i1 orf=471-710(+)